MENYKLYNVEDDFFTAFSQRLNYLLKNKNINQSELASKLNTTRQAVSKYMNFKAIPNPVMIIKIALLFDVSVDYLLGLDDTKKHPSTSINGYAKKCYDAAKNKGFFEDRDIKDYREICTDISIIHAELSEVVEILREKDIESKHNFNLMSYEFADVIMRLFTLCYALEINLEECISQKIEYNKIRKYRHGKNF